MSDARGPDSTSGNSSWTPPPSTRGAADLGPWGGAALFALALLTALNFLNYVDRYVLAAVLPLVKQDPAFARVGDAKLGALQTAFFYSYMVLAPLGGALGRRVSRRYIVATGVVLWSLATIASGLARNYHELLAARAAIGCGEAGYAAVAPALLSDLFHRERRNRVLSIFYLATPVGSALGFILGGKVGAMAGWRASFFVAGVPGLLLGLAALLLPEPTRGAQDPPTETRPFLDDVRALVRNAAFLRVTTGMTLMTFAVGGLAFWMPTYFHEARGLDVATANFYVGGTAVVTGVLGTLAGSALGDAWARRDRKNYVRLSGLGLLAATPFAIGVGLVDSLGATLACIVLAQLFAFVNTGPLNTALVESAPPSVREAAVGINIFFIHALGDAISPPLLGAIAVALEARGLPHARALGLAVSATAAPFFLGAIALLAGLGRRPGASPAPAT